MDSVTASFFLSGASCSRGSGQVEMATELLPAQAQVSEVSFLELPSGFRGS